MTIVAGPGCALAGPRVFPPPAPGRGNTGRWSLQEGSMASRSRNAPSSARVSLQKRDLAIMESLVQLRAATLDQLHREHFPGLTRKRAINRLGQLARAGMLAPADVVLHGASAPTRVYTLGPKARTALERRSLSSEYFRYRRWNPTLRDSSIPHQLVVNRLTGALDGTTVPEHLLPVPDKNAARNRPDAVVEGVDVDGATRWLGLEVDLGHYSRERIVGKVKAWRSYPEAATLIIVVPDEARRRRVQSWVVHESGVCVWVITTDKFYEELDYALSPQSEGQFVELDIWTGGDAFDGERERARLIREERARQRAEEEAERQAEMERNRQAAEAARRQAEQQRQQAARRGRRRFGV